MYKFHKIHSIWLFIAIHLYSQQQSNDCLDPLLKSYKNFQYTRVIHLADSLIQTKKLLADDIKIEINRLKGISYYALGSNDSAHICFKRMIQIDRNYQLDKIRNSPKIITLYNQIREEVITSYFLQPEDQYTTTPKGNISRTEPSRTGAHLRTALLPGWGQYYIGQHTKSKWIGTAGIAALTSTIYFSIQTSHRKQDYLNATDPSVITSKYDRYNKAYKYRNTCLLITGIIWIYAQADLLFFNNTASNLYTLHPKILGENVTISLTLHL